MVVRQRRSPRPLRERPTAAQAPRLRLILPPRDRCIPPTRRRMLRPAAQFDRKRRSRMSTVRPNDPPSSFSNARQTPGESSPTQIAKRDPSTPRVLVVDDEELITRALARYLGTRGYEVETASSGQ